MPAYGRKPHPDQATALAAHPLRQHRNLAAVTSRTPKTWLYPYASPLNQGQNGTCVGFAWKGWELTLPVHRTNKNGHPTAIEWYVQARREDPQTAATPNDLQDGSTTMDGAKAAVTFGLLSHFDWAQSVDDVLDYLCGRDAAGAFIGGPMVFGSNYYYGMETVGADGFVRIGPNDQVAGGHDYLVLGADPQAGWVELLNSWGRDFGYPDRLGRRSGRARMDLATVERLLFREGGDAAAAAELAKAKA